MVNRSTRIAWWWRLIRVGASLGLCYAGVTILMLFFETSMLYHPDSAGDDWVRGPDARVQDIELKSADGTRIHAWWCPRPGAEGAVLYCHGNAGNLSHRSGAVAEWQEGLNQSVLIFDYPGYGKSTGSPSEAGCCAAATASYEWLSNEARVPAERILIFGTSLGGGVAVDLAARVPSRALVLLATFTSVPDRAQELFPLLPARWLVRNRFSNLAKIGNCRQPVFIAHGDRDDVVPISHGRNLFAAANEPKCFLELTNFGHWENPGNEFFARLKQFLSKKE
jgi:fermentation-respiration switch protein FrsA (DUF1100 family)